MGEYYYVEFKNDFEKVMILHSAGCLKHRLSTNAVTFIGTFYRPEDALLVARQRYKNCRCCPHCCKIRL